MTLTVTNQSLSNSPFDCRELICYFTDYKGLIELQKTSRAFRDLIRSEKMQEFLLMRDYGFKLPSQIDSSTSAPSQYYRRLSGINASRVSGLLSQTFYYQNYYKFPGIYDPIVNETCGCTQNMKSVPSTVVTISHDKKSLHIWTFSPQFSYKNALLNTITPIRNFQITPDGTKVIVDTACHLHLINLQTGNYLWMVHRDQLHLAGCNDEEVFLMSWEKLEGGGHVEGCYEVLDLQTGNVRRVVSERDGPAAIEKWLDGKKDFLLGYRQGKLGIFDCTTFSYTDKCEIGNDSVLHAKITPDKTRAVVINSEPSLKVWDLDSGVCLKQIKLKHSDLRFLQISHDANRAILAWGNREAPADTWRDQFILIDLKNETRLGIYGGSHGTGSAIGGLEHNISRWRANVQFTSDGLGLIAANGADGLNLYNFYPLPEERLRHEAKSELITTSPKFPTPLHSYTPTHQINYWPKDIRNELGRLLCLNRLTTAERFILYNAIHETLPAIKDCLKQMEEEESTLYKHLLLNDVKRYFLRLEEPVQQVIYINLLDILREKGLLPETVPAGFEKQIFSSEIECPLSIKKEAIDRALNEIRMKAELPPIPNTALPTLK